VIESSRSGPPRVTVVVPAHNAARFLTQALESVVRQTYADWEAVVVDDASSDETGHIASSFAARHPNRIRAVRLGTNAGPAVARRAAIDASSGAELIALLDADDYWQPTYLEHQIGVYDRARAQRKRVGIVACNALLDTPGGILEETFADCFGWLEPVDYDSMIRRSYIFVTAMFTRAAYEEVGGFSPECWGSEDYDLWLRIMETGYTVASSREPVAVYRLHPASLSRNQLRMAEAGITAYRRALARRSGSPRQVRAIKARLRHYRALRERALVRQALTEGRRGGVALQALKAAPYGLLAFLQDPSRWREWARDILRRDKKPRGPGPLVRAHS
jgi:glycosyltransferase involved in cell wall biosynthesis